MFTNALSLVSIALAAVASVSALPVPRATKPSTYAEGYLEPYDTYHTRYLAIGCQNKHNTDFFNSCCHPMLATETLATARPAFCAPGASTPASSTQSAPEPTTTVEPTNGGNNVGDPTDTGDEDCGGGDTTTAPPSAPTPVPPIATAPAPTTTPTPPADPPVNNPGNTPPPSTTTPEAPAPAPTGDVHSGGFATFFFQNNTPGACGKVHSDDDIVVAMDAELYGDAGNSSPLCGKQVQITRVSTGKSIVAVVADDCPTCVNANSIDLSTGAFNQLGSPDEGTFPISWTFV